MPKTSAIEDRDVKVNLSFIGLQFFSRSSNNLGSYACSHVAKPQSSVKYLKELFYEKIIIPSGEFESVGSPRHTFPGKFI